MLGNNLGLNIDSPSPIFKAFDNGQTNGVALLDANLISNSITKTPDFRYNGIDATASTWPAWTYGNSLSTSGSGADPTPSQGSPLLGARDGSVKFNGDGNSGTSKYYQATAGAFGALSTNDFVFEFVYKHITPLFGSPGVNLANYASAGIGWQIIISTGGVLFIQLNDGSVTKQPATPALTSGTWNHVMIFADKSENSNNGCLVYVNGIAQSTTAQNNLSTVGDLTNNKQFRIGGNSVNDFNSNVAYLTLWTGSSWFAGEPTNSTEWAAIAKDRFSRLSGIYPTKATGTAVPVSFTRSSVAQLEKIDAYGSQLLSDADMETAGVASWIAYQANLTKISGSRPGGVGSQVLRIEQNAGASSSTGQLIITNNSLYRFSGWARVPDGNTPKTAVIRSFPNNYKTFTITDDWQKFDFFFVGNDTGARGLEIGHSGTTGDVSEWDDLSCTEVVRKQYSVGPGWMRVDSVLDGYSNLISGYRSEESKTNLFLQSNTLNTTWNSATVAISENRMSVEDNVVLQGLIPNATNNNHLIQQSVILTEGYYTFSVIVAPGVRTACRIDVASVANTTANFTLSGAGSVFSKGSNVTNARITNLGRAMYKIELTFGTPDVTSNFRIWVDLGNYLGDAVSVGIFAGFAQLENHNHATSHIKTTSGTATRSADDLYYKADNGNLNLTEGTLVCNFLIPERDQPSDTNISYASTDGAAVPRIVNFISASSRVARMFVTPSVGNSASISATTNTATNKINEYRSTWKSNDTRVYINRTREGVDTSVDMPTGINRLSIGSGNSGTLQFNGIISNLRIYNKATEK